MPNKPLFTQPSPALVIATCVCSLFLSPGKMLGATLTLSSDTSFTDQANLIDADSSVDSLIAPESLTAEALVSLNDGNSQLALGGGLPNESSEKSVNASLSLQSIIGTLSQIKLEGRGNQGEIPEISVLPQVKSADVFKEVYDFTPKVPRKSLEPITGISFSTQTFAPVPSLDNFTQGRISLSAPAIRLPVQGGALSFLGVSQETGISGVQTPRPSRFVANLGGLSDSLKLSPKVDARFGILPGINLNSTLEDTDQRLAAVAQEIDDSYQLKILTDFHLMPQVTFAMQLNLTDSELKSTLIRRDVDVISSRLKNQLQENSQRYQQEFSQQQANYQQRIQRNFEQQKRRQQAFDQETARRQQAQQQRIVRR